MGCDVEMKVADKSLCCRLAYKYSGSASAASARLNVAQLRRPRLGFDLTSTVYNKLDRLGDVTSTLHAREPLESAHNVAASHLRISRLAQNCPGRQLFRFALVLLPPLFIRLTLPPRLSPRLRTGLLHCIVSHDFPTTAVTSHLPLCLSSEQSRLRRRFMRPFQYRIVCLLCPHSIPTQACWNAIPSPHHPSRVDSYLHSVEHLLGRTCRR